MSICSVDATFSTTDGTLSSRIVPICQFVSATIIPCLFLHCFLIFPAEKQFVQRHAWLFETSLCSGDCFVCVVTAFFYLRGHDYTREFFLIKLSPLGNITAGFLFTYSIAGQLLLLHTCFAAPFASQRRQARWLFARYCCRNIPTSYLYDNSAGLGCLDSLRSLFGLHLMPYPDLLCHRDYPTPVDEYRTHYQSQRCVYTCQWFRTRNLSVKHSRTHHIFPYSRTFSDGDCDIGAYCRCYCLHLLRHAFKN